MTIILKLLIVFCSQKHEKMTTENKTKTTPNRLEQLLKDTPTACPHQVVMSTTWCLADDSVLQLKRQYPAHKMACNTDKAMKREQKLDQGPSP